MAANAESLITSTKLAARATSLRAAKSCAIAYWAWIGAAFMAFEGYTFLKWILGPNFKPTDPGTDPISDATLTYFFWIQILVPAGAVIGLWFWVIRPWLRAGRLTSDGMIALTMWSMVFWDCSMNYTSAQLIYNSHLINMGAWTAGSWFGWTSPNGQLLPEPLLMTVPGYLIFGMPQILVVCWLLRKAKERWPNLGIAGMVGLIILGTSIADSIVEGLLVKAGLYAFPGAIRGVSLFAGETYQFPLTEGLTFGGFAIGSLIVLRAFRDDKGNTFVERGGDQLTLPTAQKQGLRFLAIFGYGHLMFLLFFMVPSQWLATHSDPFPAGYPSYMINNMCAYGPERNQCPGPGVMMPRPENNP